MKKPKELIVTDGAYGHLIDANYPKLKKNPWSIIEDLERQRDQLELYSNYNRAFPTGVAGIVFTNNFGARKSLENGNADTYLKYIETQGGLVQQAIGNTPNRYSGNKIGPAGDCYEHDDHKDHSIHDTQLWAAKKLQKDYGISFTIAETNPDEAGPKKILEYAGKHRTDVVISYFVDKNGRLPNGREFGAAIKELVSNRNSYLLGVMINCCPPEAIPHVIESCEKHGVLDDFLGFYPNTADAVANEKKANTGGKIINNTKKSIDIIVANAPRLQPKNGLKIIGGCCGHGPEAVCQICQRT
jgi:S-methylmethionine-dependent homocysteine/selenocysteine methylase